MGWSVWGLILAGIIALFAWSRSRRPGGFYDADIYGLTPRDHAIYGSIAAAFAVAFALTALLALGTITLYLFAAFVVFAVFYLTSFLRGAHEDDQ
ncbi:MAG TPA: hypothetical protein VFN49_08055 [Candidatus Aquilonibacter sp.]|nr:hypothetical protein [Candidatus Aquilonibacter sp.]